MEFYHEPIMLSEIVEGLNLSPSSIIVDCTLGGGGHSSEIIKRIPDGRLIGIDKDSEAIEYTGKRLESYKNVTLVQSDFKQFTNVLEQLGIDKVDGVLVDLGVSSHQIDTPERGFSLRFDGPLDMRMNKQQKVSAFEIVNMYSKQQLTDILYRYGEERFTPRIVANILKRRKEKPITTTFELKAIVEEVLPKKVVYKFGGATRVFQAIRIEVNNELSGLTEVLSEMIERLEKGGRLAVLTFHSLEDRIVKQVFKHHATDCICPPQQPICTCSHRATVKLIAKKPITATEAEMLRNPRSTSAKLRIVEKV